jgi:hypothetical protein
MAVVDRDTSAQWQPIPIVHKRGRFGLADFARDRKGSAAVRVALMVFGPMILLDAAIGLLS